MSIDIFYSTNYNCEGLSIDTREKAKWIVDSLETDPISGVILQEPPTMTSAQMGAVHSVEYTSAIFTGVPLSVANRNGIGNWSPGLRSSILASTGGVIESAIRAFQTRANSGSLSSGLHHAGKDSGNGFCSVNGLALAAQSLLDHGARRVLILDLDAHCGGGTASLIRGMLGVEQVDVSVSSYDQYQSTTNTQLTMSDGRNYLADIDRTLESILSPASIDVVIYNAGMDPHEDCHVGGVRGITTEVLAQREAMVFDWAQKNSLPVSFALAGGYSGPRLSRDELVNLHRLTITTAANY